MVGQSFVYSYCSDRTACTELRLGREEKGGNAGYPREPSHLLGPRGPKQLCQSVGREARQTNTSDNTEAGSPYIGRRPQAELSASCLTAFVRRLRPLGPISAPAHPHQVRPTGNKRKGDLGPKADSSRLMPSGRTIHWALPRGYEANRRSLSNHCGGDRDRVRPTSHDSSKLDGCGRVRKVDYH